MKKDEIIRRLKDSGKQVEELVDALGTVDSEDARLSRVSRNKVAITLFELIDDITSIEADIYNFLKES